MTDHRPVPSVRLDRCIVCGKPIRLNEGKQRSFWTHVGKRSPDIVYGKQAEGWK